jgi:lipoyl(octanoyl) transferase
MRSFTAYRLGSIAYAQAHALQERLVAARQADEIGDTVLLLEHPKVITLGRAAKQEHVLFSEEALHERGYELFSTGRGGDVTFHGPGQLVMYPILDLKPDREDVRRYVKDLEETMIRCCADYGISAERAAGLNGAWVGENKIGAIGVRLSRWVTMHGLAINVNTDLSSFGAIVPCGIAGRGVTSLHKELGGQCAVTLDEVGERCVRHLAGIFEAELQLRDGAPEI